MVLELDTNNVELITKMVIQALNQQEAKKSEQGFLVPVGVSARHVHLTQEHVEILFGEGYHLTKKKVLKPLLQHIISLTLINNF